MQVTDAIENLKPYQPGKPIEETQREYGLSEVVKLASNESPLGPSPKVIEALQKAIYEIHRYPDASFYRLTQAYSSYYKVPTESLTFGNGSNELIDLLIRTYCRPGDKILTSKYAFIAYKLCAQAFSVTTLEAEVGEDLVIQLDEVFKEYLEHKPKLIFLPNPNNPTGTYLGRTQIDAFLEKMKSEKGVKIVFDEAYNEYVRADDYADSLHWVEAYENVLSLRTMSKIFGLAGLRVGALIGDAKTVSYINRVRTPFNVSVLAQEAAVAVLDDKEYIKKSQQFNWQGLDYFYAEFEKMGLRYWPSQTNFVLFDSGQDGAQVYEKMIRQGVIIRPLKGYGLENALRISVGLPSENEKAVEALRKALA